MKDKSKINTGSNYNLITFLPSLVLTGILSEVIYKQIDNHNLLLEEEKGFRKKTREERVIYDI